MTMTTPAAPAAPAAPANYVLPHNNEDDDPFNQLLSKNVSILDQLISASAASAAAGAAGAVGAAAAAGVHFSRDGDNLVNQAQGYEAQSENDVRRLESSDGGVSQILQPDASGRLFLTSSVDADATSAGCSAAPLEDNQVRVVLNDANEAVIQTSFGQTLQVAFDRGESVTTDMIQMLLNQIVAESS